MYFCTTVSKSIVKIKINRKQGELANPEHNFPSLLEDRLKKQNKTKSPWLPSLTGREVGPFVNPTYRGSWLPAEPVVPTTVAKTPDDQRKGEGLGKLVNKKQPSK